MIDVDTDTQPAPRYRLTRVKFVTEPAGPPVNPFAVAGALGILAAVGIGGWAVVIGLGWLLWAYTAVMLSIIVSCLVVAGCIHLAVRGNWRARTIAAVSFGALVALIFWTVAR